MIENAEDLNFVDIRIFHCLQIITKAFVKSILKCKKIILEFYIKVIKIF